METSLDTASWPKNVIDLDTVKAWISSVLPDHPAVSGPMPVYAGKENFGVTARFRAAPATPSEEYDVIYKANLYPGYAGAPFAFSILSRYCPDNAPSVIAWEENGGRSSILTRPFTGIPISEIDTVESLSQLAAALAAIQNRIAQIPSSELANLYRVTPEILIEMFDELLNDIRERDERVWQTDGDGKLTIALGFPSQEVRHRMEDIREDVIMWAHALNLEQFPETIGHGDLHSGNAVLLDNGKVLIYDWEDTFCSHPFLSVERLLVQAWNQDTGEHGPWGYERGTPSQAIVRQAYLKALYKEVTPEIERVFDFAMGLAVIREAHVERHWALSIGWWEGNPEWTAQLIRRLFQHRDTIREKVPV